MDNDLRQLERDIRYDYEQLIAELRREVRRLEDRLDAMQHNLNNIINGDEPE